MEKKRIAIVDDHSIVREGLEMMLSFHFGKEHLSSYSNGAEILNAIEHEKKEFDLLVLDVQLPDIMAFSLIPNILKLNSKQAILVFSMYPEEVMAESMFDLGALGYVNKQAGNNTILDAVTTILRGKRFISEHLKAYFSNKYLNRDSMENPLKTLSNRELEVAMLLIQGMGVLEIGNNLQLNSSTVATYKSRIFEKMSVKNVIELYHKGVSLGLV